MLVGFLIGISLYISLSVSYSFRAFQKKRIPWGEEKKDKRVRVEKRKRGKDKKR
jgi:hypothetical protein